MSAIENPNEFANEKNIQAALEIWEKRHIADEQELATLRDANEGHVEMVARLKGLLTSNLCSKHTPPDPLNCDLCNKVKWLENANLERMQKMDTLRQQLAEAQKRFTAPIVCMCGSTKFKQSWITENARLTGEGNIVLSVGLWGHQERVYPDAETTPKA